MLKGKTILVTGGFGRLGTCLTGQLVDQGARAIVTTRDPDKAGAFNGKKASRAGSVVAEVLAMDDATQVRKFVHTMVADHGPISGLVNNAYSELPHCDVGDIPWSHWEESFRVGVAAAETLAAELVALKPESGIESIVNVSSIYGQIAPQFDMYAAGEDPNPVYYGATKAALNALTRYLAAYWAGKGVRVNSVSPGGILSGQKPAFLKRYGRTVPMGRMVTPEEVSAAIIFLLSDGGSAITGTDLVVDGGKTVW